MKRRDFIQVLGGALLGGAAVSAIAGCGDDGSTAPAVDATQGGGCANNGATGTVGTNHGHALTVSASDVTAGVEKTLSITGASSHDHDVTLTAANMTTLQGGGMVTVDSTSGGGHTHSVTVVCA